MRGMKLHSRKRRKAPSALNRNKTIIKTLLAALLAILFFSTVKKSPILNSGETTQKFLQFRVCKGLNNQVNFFLNGLALAHFSQRSVILPNWYKNYSFVSLDFKQRQALTGLQEDPEKDNAVPMDVFWDVEHFINEMSPLIKIEKRLPANVDQADVEWFDTDNFRLNPALPSTYGALTLSNASVLQCPCLSGGPLHWSTPELGALRMKAFSSLKPSPIINSYVEKRLSIALARQKRYLGIHLRNEEDWYHFCKRHNVKSGFDSCYLSAAAAAAKVAPYSRLFPFLYVASGNMTRSDIGFFLDAGFEYVQTSKLSCSRKKDGTGAVTCLHVEENLPNDREFLAAIDLQMMLRADFFIGNTYSTFSTSVKYMRFARLDVLDAGSDSIYINDSNDFLDVTPIERDEFRIYPGTFRPEWYEDSCKLCLLHKRMENRDCLLRLNQSDACWTKYSGCPAGCAPPKITSLQFSYDFKRDFIKIKIRVRMEQFLIYPKFFLTIQNDDVGIVSTKQVVANEKISSRWKIEDEMAFLHQFRYNSSIKSFKITACAYDQCFSDLLKDQLTWLTLNQ